MDKERQQISKYSAHSVGDILDEHEAYQELANAVIIQCFSDIEIFMRWLYEHPDCERHYERIGTYRAHSEKLATVTQQRYANYLSALSALKGGYLDRFTDADLERVLNLKYNEWEDLYGALTFDGKVVI